MRAAGSRKIIQVKWMAVAAGKAAAKPGFSMYLLISAQ